jgi:predicted metal-dependent enzyme (double-stranded beta helix superfamily)
MRLLIDSLREILANRCQSIDQGVLDEVRSLVQSSIPRLQSTLLCQRALKPGRYLCYKDPDFGFVVMCLVWGEGDATPIHDHGTWGVEAVLRSTLAVTNYSECEQDPRPLDTCVCKAGAVIYNLPGCRDVHKVAHHSGDYAVSLHIYGREMTGNRMFVPGEGFKCCKLECRSLIEELELDGLHFTPKRTVNL